MPMPWGRATPGMIDAAASKLWGAHQNVLQTKAPIVQVAAAVGALHALRVDVEPARWVHRRRGADHQAAAGVALIVDIGTVWWLRPMSLGGLNIRAAFIHWSGLRKLSH